MTIDIKRIIERNIFGPARIDIEPEAELRAIGCDELAIHGIALDIGDEIGTDIPDDVAEKWVTVEDVMRAAGEIVE